MSWCRYSGGNNATIVFDASLPSPFYLRYLILTGIGAAGVELEPLRWRGNLADFCRPWNDFFGRDDVQVAKSVENVTPPAID